MKAVASEEVIVSRACGLDVHKNLVVACVLISDGSNKRPQKEIRKFGTFTEELRRLKEWLQSLGVTHVGMESTGVYWMPVYAVLEEEPTFNLIVGNAQHMKNVPGRKTDMKDAEWIARLIRLGLVAKSFVPPADLRQLRDLTRYRTQLVRAQASERNRLLKVLESANIKLDSVASDCFGKSGTAMLEALASGETDATKLANLAQGLLRKKLPELQLALTGKFGEHHRFILKLQLQRLREATAQIEALEAEIERRLEPYREQVDRLCTIPGVKQTVAATMVAEMGVRMEEFPSADHLAAWVGVCPGNNESAGKSRKVTVRKGNTWLRTALVEAANAAKNKRNCYLREKYWQAAKKRGRRHAAMVLAHKLLLAAYHVLRNGEPYRDLGVAYLNANQRIRRAQNHLKGLAMLGYKVRLEQSAA